MFVPEALSLWCVHQYHYSLWALQCAWRVLCREGAWLLPSWITHTCWVPATGGLWLSWNRSVKKSVNGSTFMNHWEGKGTLSISENWLSFQDKRQQYCGIFSTQILHSLLSLPLVIIILKILDLTFYTLFTLHSWHKKEKQLIVCGTQRYNMLVTQFFLTGFRPAWRTRLWCFLPLTEVLSFAEEIMLGKCLPFVSPPYPLRDKSKWD